MKKGPDMSEDQAKACVEQPVAGGLPEASAKGFVFAATSDDIKPTDREASLLRTLGEWQESSARSRIVLGQPIGY